MIACVSLQAASITTLLKGADAVVIGTESNETQSGNQILFNLDIERVFTGSIQAGQVVEARTPNQTANPLMLTRQTGYRGIWFLKALDGGGWECAQAWHLGNGPVILEYFAHAATNRPLPACLAYDPASTPIADQLLFEIAGGDFSNGVIMDSSGDMSSPAVARVFHYLEESGTEEQGRFAMAALIGHGDIASLLGAEKIAGSLGDGTGGATYLINAIGNSHLTDPVAIACLGRMATTLSSPSPLRAQAAHALYVIHTADTVPWLGALLSDSFRPLQLTAAMGLSVFVSGVGIQTPATMPTLSHLNQRQPGSYRTVDTDQHLGYAKGQESSFLDYWTSWWGRHPELHAQN
jgi:hypothetical protein